MARNNGSLAWPVTLDPAEEGGFNVNFPDFPEGFTQGDSLDEALAQAADLLETMVANYMAEGWDLPAPLAAVVPASNGSSSKAPNGPFQTSVRVDSSSASTLAIDFGPMSRITSSGPT